MSIISRIIALIMAVFFFVFPWINKADVEKESYVIKNGTAVISLDSNPSTGYGWEYEIEGKGIKFDSEKFVSSSKNPNIVGAPGTEKLKFVADGEGDFVITLSYCRSWEDVEPIKTATVKGSTDNGIISFTSFETK